MRSFESPRFGQIEVEEDKIICFTRGLPGFPECREFIVMDHDKETPLRWLHCVDRPEVAFLIIEPAQVLASYQLEIPPSVLSTLDWDTSRSEGCEVVIFVILNADASGLTANLRAPVVVNPRNRRAHQLILDDPALSLRHVIRPVATTAG